MNSFANFKDISLLTFQKPKAMQRFSFDPDLLYKTEEGCGYPFHEEMDLPSCIPNHHYVEEIDSNGDTNLFISIW